MSTICDTGDAVDSQSTLTGVVPYRTADTNTGSCAGSEAYSIADEALDDSLAATQRALALDDQNAAFYSLKARMQLARGEYDAARSESELAIALNPSLASAHCDLADTLAYQGRYDEAINRFETAIWLSPNDPQRWAFLTYGGLALMFKRDFEVAVAWGTKRPRFRTASTGLWHIRLWRWPASVEWTSRTGRSKGCSPQGQISHADSLARSFST